MKFRVGDKVKITSGKEKGKTGTIAKVLPQNNSVIIEGVNVYTKHIRPMAGRPGEKVDLERPLPTAKIAILNEENEVDRIGYSVDKKGNKTRIYKKTGTVIPENTDKKKTKK